MPRNLDDLADFAPDFAAALSPTPSRELMTALSPSMAKDLVRAFNVNEDREARMARPAHVSWDDRKVEPLVRDPAPPPPPPPAPADPEPKPKKVSKRKRKGAKRHSTLKHLRGSKRR